MIDHLILALADAIDMVTYLKPERFDDVLHEQYFNEDLKRLNDVLQDALAIRRDK